MRSNTANKCLLPNRLIPPQMHAIHILAPCLSTIHSVPQLSSRNVVRWRHAFFPPADEVLGIYEAQGYEQGTAWAADYE